MTSDGMTRISKFHSDFLRNHGAADYRPIGYPDRQAQIAQFEIFASLFECGNSVLDTGCGTGYLCRYLSTQCSELAHIGIEQQHDFIEKARREPVQHGRARFVEGDFHRLDLPKSDSVVAFGVFNYRQNSANAALATITRF